MTQPGITRALTREELCAKGIWDQAVAIIQLADEWGATMQADGESQNAHRIEWALRVASINLNRKANRWQETQDG